MEENYASGIVYPDDLYVTLDRNGDAKLFVTDPMEGNPQGIDLSTVITSTFGVPDNVNVVKIRIKGVFLHRGEEFNLTIPGKIRNGTIEAHIRDLEGRLVEILEYPSNVDKYPIQGVLIDQVSRQVTGHRNYDTFGKCEDGDESHSLVTVYGKI